MYFLSSFGNLVITVEHKERNTFECNSLYLLYLSYTEIPTRTVPIHYSILLVRKEKVCWLLILLFVQYEYIFLLSSIEERKCFAAAWTMCGFSVNVRNLFSTHREAAYIKLIKSVILDCIQVYYVCGLITMLSVVMFSTYLV